MMLFCSEDKRINLKCDNIKDKSLDLHTHTYICSFTCLVQKCIRTVGDLVVVIVVVLG